jgi:membrane protein YdbS with pleckstrin-like domain
MPVVDDQAPGPQARVSSVQVRITFLTALVAAIALGIVCGAAGLSTAWALLVMGLALVMALPALVTLALLLGRRWPSPPRT